MRNIKSFSGLTILILVLFTIISCNKRNDNDLAIGLNNSDIIETINTYQPNANNVKNLFVDFINDIKLDKMKLKSKGDMQDRTIDEAMWLMNASLNRDYGFKNDSIEYLVIDTTEIIIPISSFSADNIPIVDGESILEVYSDIENKIIGNLNNGFNFWSIAFILEDYNEEELTIMSISSGGPRADISYLITPVAPGTPLPLFDEDDYLYAGSSYQEPCRKIHWPANTASYRFYQKYSQGSPNYFDPDYVYTYMGYISKNAYIEPGVAEDRIFWDYACCGYRIIYGPELNQYLLSTKDLIDELNPAYGTTPDLIIGLFQINCQDFIYNPQSTFPQLPSPGPYTNQTWCTHNYYAQVFKKTFIGSIND